ncbi:SRPBCC family protein [Peribacillus sp. SCS-37]|uniref:SRPBCC family protein n=1 Tax=Paraperibacillus esterisolvens TaxID=3115296 RepID=UPI003906337A
MKLEQKDSELKVERILDAPRELVFRAWTEKEHFEKWWGPKGFNLNVVKMEAQPEGLFLGSQKSPEGHEMWGKFVYKDVNRPQRLVYLSSFSDPEGNTIRAPFSDTWPLEISNTISLTEEGSKTRMTMTGGPVGASREEMSAFAAAGEMVKQGLDGTIDQLQEYLKTMQKK